MLVGVKPFLVYGTLLGFVRENDFLPHDNDIDLGLLDDDFQKKHLIKEILSKKGYRLRFDDGYSFEFIHPEWPYLFVDFYRVFKKRNHMVIETLSDVDMKTVNSYYFPLEAMDEFRIVNFHKSKISIPSDPTIFLSTAYGEWQIPNRKFCYLSDYKNLHINDVKHQK